MSASSVWLRFTLSFFSASALETNSPSRISKSPLSRPFMVWSFQRSAEASEEKVRDKETPLLRCRAI